MKIESTVFARQRETCHEGEREREGADTNLELFSMFSPEDLNRVSSRTNFKGSLFNDEMVPFWLKYMNSVLSASRRD